MTKQLYRPTGGQWLSSNGGIILPPFVSPKGRVAAVRASALDKIVQPAQPFTLGTTKPDATNTGPRIPVSAMTIVNGDYTASTANSVVQGLDIRGNLLVTAANVTVQDCMVRGRVNTDRIYAGQPFLVNFSNTGGLIQFCDVGFDTSFGGFPHYSQNGIGGANWTASRCNIHDATDWTDGQAPPAGQPAGTIKLLGNYLHDISMRNDDKDQSGGTNPGSVADPWWSHSDGCQLKGTANSVIKGNSFNNYASSTTTWDGGPGASFAPRTAGSPYGVGVQITVDIETNIEVSYNWFQGGDVGFAANRPNVTGALGSFFGNRLAFDQYTKVSSRYTVRWSKTTTMICPNVPGSGGDGLDPNIWDPDGPNVPTAKQGLPLTVGTSGGIRIP